MGGFTAQVASSTAKVNGPEDDLEDWAAIDWRAHEDNVRRLRQRIFKATGDGDLRRVRRLQKLSARPCSLSPAPSRIGSQPAINLRSIVQAALEACLSRVR